MANTSEYLGEAYEALQKLSADETKRLEYEEREKALKDYNTFVVGAQRRAEERGRKIGEKRGEKRGRKSGRKEGIALAKRVFRLHAQGKTEQDIAAECGIAVEEVREILE